ncbi:hypothetical protein Hypma_016305 [Hypsizygus marmoreus]|uniref:ENTH domain-containing protein n=1 Tax=Hypsizygus marmoreus TaxID=39966 RepID=A0A369IXX1_HYPMA|nr:hypothetical protein Hypma_016305 [Hypsizygus marmoreus]
MDRLEALGNTLSQITLYDIKSAYNQAKNVVLNVSEMEAKVREATNEDPWGASSTLMQDIAQGTFTFQQFNEIMPCIYARFMEKEARQWRQIYKALQLLEYLIKHGSERVVDDARSHVSMIKMLRNFHYIDDKGKDEGVNVRNRSREIVELLADVDKIRSERRKAKANKHKYTGTGNDGFGGGMSFSSGGSRYGGFGSDTFSNGGGGGGYGNDYGSYGAGGSGAGGQSSFRDDTRRGGFEEYNAGDDEVVATPSSAAPRSYTPGRTPPTRKATAPPPPAPVEDLLGGFGDDDAFGSTSTSTTAATSASNGLSGLGMNKALPAVAAPAVAIDDDDFADFQAAPIQTTATPGANTMTTVKPNLMDMLGHKSSQSAVAQTGFVQTQQPATGGLNLGGGLHRSTPSISSQLPKYSSPMQPQNFFGGGGTLAPTTTSFAPAPRSTAAPAPSAQTKPASATFDDLWSMSLGTNTSKPTGGANNGTSKSIKDLEKEKAMAGLWGSQKRAGSAPIAPGAGTGTNAFGSFGSPSSGGGDDLLL